MFLAFSMEPTPSDLEDRLPGCRTISTSSDLVHSCSFSAGQIFCSASMQRATVPEFSNVFASFDDFGLIDREYRVWEGAAFVQDDYGSGSR